MSAITENVPATTKPETGSSSATEPEKTVLELLEEDDEFMEFEGATWEQDFKKQDAEDGRLWQDDWEDDDANDDFIQQLREQIATNAAATANSGGGK